MSAETLFSISNVVAALGWLLLIVVPKNTRAIWTAGRLIPLLFSGVYLGLLVTHWGEARGSLSSLQGVSELFSNPWLLLAGWMHYLGFDLFVGAWENRDAVSRGVSRWLVVPCLLLTFLVGPVGWLAYSLARTVGRKPDPARV